MIFLQIFWGYCLDPDSNSYWLVLVSLLAKENVLKGNFAVKSNKQASKQANKQTKTKQPKVVPVIFKIKTWHFYVFLSSEGAFSALWLLLIIKFGNLN